MFTGIIEELGKITTILSDKITIECKKVLNETDLGDSIAVNGVCLTVVNITNNSFTADISPQTFNVTALGTLKINQIVNLERALTLNTRLGGHIVSGHIDSVGKIIDITKSNDFYNIVIEYDKKYTNNVVEKGSIAINGISLTVANCKDNFLTVAVIPHTFYMTALNQTKVGDNVNIEFDILSKYVEKILSSRDNNNITVNFLAENGFC